MPLIEIREPTPAALRWFGLPFAAVMAIVAALVGRSLGAPIASGIGALAAAVLVIYYAAPKLRRGIYLGWIYASYPIGFVLSHLAMAVVYYLVLTPIALLVRATGRSAVERKIDARAESYWQRRRERSNLDSYFRQF
jgi:hypothetical protein